MKWTPSPGFTEEQVRQHIPAGLLAAIEAAPDVAAAHAAERAWLRRRIEDAFVETLARVAEARALAERP